MSRARVSFGQVDLTSCDREPIHIPGCAQGHCALWAIELDRRVTARTENARALFAVDALGERLDVGFPPALASALSDALRRREALRDNPELIFSGALPTREGIEEECDVTAHVRADRLIVELERRARALPWAHRLETSPDFRDFARARTVAALCDRVVTRVRELTGYDRVMLYQFAPDAHGWVRSEARDPALVPFLDLHYPASDIPSQARALFLENRTRLLVDRDAPTSPIEALFDAPLDLSHSIGRAVSPIHLEYLANMGVRASLSVALEVDGELWGLIACHHYAGPRHLGHEARATCELLAQLISLRIGALESQADRRLEDELSERHAIILNTLARAETIDAGVAACHDELRAHFPSCGLSLVIHDAVRHEGRTLPDDALRRALAGDEPVVATDRVRDLIGDDWTSALPAGMLAVRFPHAPRSCLVWYREEQLRTVRWGGDPTKPASYGPNGARLTPRKSFEAWCEDVRARSEPWTRRELRAARRLASALSDVIYRERDRVARLRRELELRNRELDIFTTMASHDLREPLRGIANYATFLREDAGPALDEQSQEHLRRVQRLVRRMYDLIEGMLTLSRVGRRPAGEARVDLGELARAVALDHRAQIEARGATVTIGALPAVLSWEVGLRMVLSNLLLNALRYSEGAPVIELGSASAATVDYPADVSPDAVAVFVRDRGIGIAEEHHEAIFRVFHRLHPGDRFGGGTGVGLAIVRKVIESLGGRIWLSSRPGEGSTFYFTLPAGTP